MAPLYKNHGSIIGPPIMEEENNIINKASYKGCQGTSPIYKLIKLHVARPSSLASNFECSIELVDEQFQILDRARWRAALNTQLNSWASNFKYLKKLLYNARDTPT